MPVRILPVLGLAFVLTNGAAAAQAPVITVDGDPSVVDDTIYSLVVDPSDHPEEGSVLLLDDGVVRLEADGSGVRTYRMVAQVLKPEAVSQWAEHTFGYEPGRQHFRLNWARVLDLDGNVLAAEPLHVQDTEVPAPAGVPVFTEQRRVRVSLASVAPGTVVDYSYTVETLDPVRTGDFMASWVINPGVVVRRSRLLLDLPEGYEARIREIGLDFEPVVERRNGRVVRQWLRADIPAHEPELFAAQPDGIMQYLLYGGDVEWSDIAVWYDSLAAGRYEASASVTSKLAALVRDAATLEDSLRALHRFVAQDVRYVSLSLGMGGYQPRPAAEVLASLSGDCKDKTTLFVAMAREMGLVARPVLTATSGRVERDVPSIQAFDHVIARVETETGPLYLDLTADLVPYGELPGALHGQTGLLVRGSHGGELVDFSDPPATSSRRVVLVTAALREDGALLGTYTETATGLMQYSLREAFLDDLTGQDRRQLAQAVATGLFGATARGDSLLAFDGRDLTAAPSMSIRVEVPSATTRTPEGDHILPLPLQPVGNGDMLRYLENLEERRAAFDVGQVSSDIEAVQELRLTLPDGWTAVLPESVEAESRFGSYRGEYAQEGRVLRVTRRYLGGRGEAPPEALEELIGWLKEMTRDGVRYIVLRPDG